MFRGKNVTPSGYFWRRGTSCEIVVDPWPVSLACRASYKSARDSISRPFTSETTAMTITTAHIPAIVALIAGILILVMPRLLNIVVAVYLICIGLIGMGVLRFFRL
jgi:Protein of unknown function (DUF3096)